MQVVPLSTGDVTFAPLRSTLHPPLRFTVDTTSPAYPSEASSSECKLHLDLSLPDALFIDRDELRDHLHGLEWKLEPDVVDIERPVRFDLPLSRLRLSPSDEIWEEAGVGALEMQVKIPLHARYLEPSESGRRLVWLFSGGDTGELRGGWVCGHTSVQCESASYAYQASADISATELPLVPTLPLFVDLPTGRASHQNRIELGTTITVWLCFAYLTYKIWRTYQRLGIKETKTL